MGKRLRLNELLTDVGDELHTGDGGMYWLSPVRCGNCDDDDGIRFEPPVNTGEPDYCLACGELVPRPTTPPEVEVIADEQDPGEYHINIRLAFGRKVHVTFAEGEGDRYLDTTYQHGKLDVAPTEDNTR